MENKQSANTQIVVHADLSANLGAGLAAYFQILADGHNADLFQLHLHTSVPLLGIRGTELREYDGTDTSKPVYPATNRTVSDVFPSPAFHDSRGHHHFHLLLMGDYPCGVGSLLLTNSDYSRCNLSHICVQYVCSMCFRLCKDWLVYIAQL